MAVAEEQIVIVDEWRGLYSESWKGVIVDDAFAHPAKFSRALIRRIYDHVIAEGWATKGDSVVDPFGGVALGGFDAMRHGLNWFGCELEMRFVGLGTANILQWENRFSGMPNWGKARLLQGDSRKLVEVLSTADCCISSPPYMDQVIRKRDAGTHEPNKQGSMSNGRHCHDAYGNTEGQLGAMKEGDHSIAISSPPYAGSDLGGGDGQRKMSGSYSAEANKATKNGKGLHGNYGKTEGQLGAMPEGQLCVTSPPFESSTQVNNTPGDMTEGRPRWEGGNDSAARVKQDYADYGSPNNLGNMRGGFDAAISSPPYENAVSSGRDGIDFAKAGRPDKMLSEGYKKHYPIGAGAECDYAYNKQNDNNLGNHRGETFWSASRLILEQLHQVLTPNAHAVFVVKAFVRNKEIVDFPSQWAQLCEAVGFKLLHDHHALLTEHYGTQGGFESDKQLRVERKSFFRRLAEQKGSPRIDYENVLCFRKVS